MCTDCLFPLQQSPTLQESEANESTAGKQPSQEVEHVLVKEEEKEVGVVAVRVYWAFWLAVGNVLAPLILLSLFLMQGLCVLLLILLASCKVCVFVFFSWKVCFRKDWLFF